MSDETKVVLETDLKDAVPPTDPLVGTEDPDLKSERVQDE
jgi:hypothetical protein